MMENSNTWDFLLDFYKHDPLKIVELLNSVLLTKSTKKIESSDATSMLKSIQSFLPDINNPSYLDFLKYVCNNGEEKIIEVLENDFINGIWRNIGGNYLNVSDIYKPYLILQAMSICEKWFLLYYWMNYNTRIAKKLLKRYKRWDASWFTKEKFKLKTGTILSKTIWTNQLSREQLFPFMTLLIVLRREWIYSSSDIYIRFLKNSIQHEEPENDCLCDGLLCSIYSQYEYCDDDLSNDFKKTLNAVGNRFVETASFHPLIAKRIIDNKSFVFLYSSQEGERIEKYQTIEQMLDDPKVNFQGKRLLIDYFCPYTKVREKDVFMSKEREEDEFMFKDAQTIDSLKEKIYLSILKGDKYKEFYRKPKDGELFERIQIEPNCNSEGEIQDNRVETLRRYLNPVGDFIVVQSKEDQKLQEKLKKKFSDFRHDLKTIFVDTDIINFGNILSNTVYVVNKIESLVQIGENLLEKNDEISQIDSLQTLLKDMENDDVVIKVVNNETINIIRILRDSVEDYIEYGTEEENKKLREDFQSNLPFLRAYITEIYKTYINKCQEIKANIQFTFAVTNSYIILAGKTTFEDFTNSSEQINVVEFLEDFKLRSMSVETIPITLDYSRISHKATIRHHKGAFIICLRSIIDNAEKHGFSGTDIKEPKIHIDATEQGEFILLKICNNGLPIEMTTEEFVTRGVFKGISGHTGIGGYRIGLIAQLQGGKVEIPPKDSRTWPTEIHIYLKKEENEANNI